MAILLYESKDRKIGVELDRLARDYVLKHNSQSLISRVKKTFPKIEELVGKYNNQDGFSMEGFTNEVLGHLWFMGLTPGYIDSVYGITSGHKELLDIIDEESFFIKTLETKSGDREKYFNSLIELHGKVKDKNKLEKIIENSRNYIEKIDVFNRYFSFISGLEDRYFDDVERTIKLVNCTIPSSDSDIKDAYKLIGYIDQNPDLFGSFEDTLNAFKHIIASSDISKLVKMLPDLQAIIASLKENNLSWKIIPAEVDNLYSLSSDKRLSVIGYAHKNIKGQTKEERDSNLEGLFGYIHDASLDFIDRYSRDKTTRLGKSNEDNRDVVRRIFFFEPMLDDERLISYINMIYSKDKEWKNLLEDLNRAARSTTTYIIRMYQAPFAFPQYWESLTEKAQKRALGIIMSLNERNPPSDSWLEEKCKELIESMGILGVGRK